MNIIKEKIIDDKLAQLILDDDNITLKVVYEGICIDESAGGTWENIKDGEMIGGYLDVIVYSYIDKIANDKAFEEAWKGLGW